jgi:hypothetical protein
MLKMKVIRRGAAQVAGGSTLVLLGVGDLGCGAPVEHRDGQLAISEGAHQAVIDQGYLDFSYQAGTPLSLGFVPYSTPDEFIHTGEQLEIRVSAYTLWYRLNPSEPFPTDIERAKRLRAEFRVIFQKGGTTVREMRIQSGPWTGADVWTLNSATPSFVVPSSGVDEIAFEATLVDGIEGGSIVDYAADDFPSVVVFGGELPLKHLLFDNVGPTLRDRIIERGDLFRNNTLALSYTDWRANTLVDSFNIDRQIGTAISFGRFGQYEMPIYGDIAYEISYGAGHDGTFSGETPLVANRNSRVLPYGQGRTAHEGNVYAYGNTLNLYFHVKAYLVADYTKYTNVTSKKYVDGQRVFLRERWDNLDGQPNNNYDFPLTDAP